MRTRSSSNLPVESPPNPSTSNLKRRNRTRSKQPFILEESPVDTMADQRTMAELLRAPTKGYAKAIVVPPILVEQFKLKHSLINMMTSDRFSGLEKDNPHDHICWASRRWVEKEPPCSILTWEDLVSKFINELFPPREQQISVMKFQTFNNDFLNSAAGGNLLERRTQDVLTIIENKSKVRNSRNKSVVSQVKSSDVNSNSSSEIAKLTHAVNQQTSAVTTTMTTILKQFQATPPPAFVKVVEENYVTCGGAHLYYQCLTAGGNTFLEVRDNIQGYVLAATVNYNQGNSSYHPPGMASQIRPSGFAQPNVQNIQNRFSQPQRYNRGINFNQDQSYQASTQQNPLRSGSLPSNTITNSNGELKSITTRSGIVLDGPFILIPPPFINPEEDERVEETLTDQDLAEYTIKVPPPLVQKSKPPFQRNFIVHQRDPLHPNIPYPSRMLKKKQQEKDEEKLLELANTPLNENRLAVILKKLPEKLGDPRKFLIPCSFSDLKCKALANLGASINLMLLFVWKKLGLPELISTRMTLELANRAICTPAGITRDVFVSVGKFTFLADFVIVDYESDPRVSLILGKPFLRTARALIDVHGEEMILRDGDERLTLNMRHDSSSYSKQPQRESINMINIYDDSSEDFLENLFSTNHQSGNLTFSPHPKLTSPEVKDDVFNPEGGNVLPEKLLDLDSTKDLHPPPHHFDIESDLKEIEYLLHHDSILKDSINRSNLADNNLADTMPEMFTDEHALNYSSPPLYDEYDDDLFEDDDFLPSLEYDSFLSEDFSEDDALPSTNNEDKVFNPGILIQKNLSEITTCVAPDKNVKKLAIFHASSILEDFDPPLYELSFFKEVPRKAAVLYEYEMFKATEGELLLDTYIRYLQVINDLKKCGYFKDNYVNDAMGSKKKTVVVTSDPLALIAEKTNVSRSKEKVVVSSDSEGSDSANKKQEFVKNDNKKVEKKDDEKKRDMSRVKCYNCKKEGHFAKDCKKVKVKDYEYYKTKMLLAKKEKMNKFFWLKIKHGWNQALSSADEKISKVSYYLSESESESEYETSEYYDNSTNYGLFVNNDDDQEIFHDAIESASENFIENHIDSQKDYDKSDVDHTDSEEKNQLVDKLIRKFNKKIVKGQKRVEKANQQSKDFENQNRDLQDKYDVLKNQTTTFEMNNKELNEQLKELIEKNNDLLAQTKLLKEQLQVKHVVIDTHVECHKKYAKLEAERYVYMIRYSAYFDNDKQHRKQIADQQVLFDKMSVQMVELDKHVRDLKNKTVHMIVPSKDNLYNGRKGIGFENPSYFEKAKDLRPTLYDEKVIGLGYTPMFLTHSDEALEIEKFKRSRENKIEFAYDYGNLNANYLNEKINFEDDYFQDIINPDFEKIDSPFQQTSSLKPYVLNVFLEKIIIDLEDEVVNLLEKEKVNLEIIESLKSKEENAKVITPGMFKLNVSQCVSPISMSKLSCESKNVEIKLKRKRHTFSSVRRPSHSGVVWKKKGSSNTSNVGLFAVSVSNLNKNVKRYSRKDLLACNNSHL
nr:hypothetical protein [Tanacetum cinerariifolium]